MAETELQPHHSIQIIPPAPPPPLRNAANRPSPTLLKKIHRDTYLDICLPLYKAALSGDWKTAKQLIDKSPLVLNMSITRHYETALHIASSTKHTHFVVELVNLMMPKDLELQKQNGYTALCVAAEGGIIDIAKVMIEKNKNLLKLSGKNNMSPVLIAAMLGHKDMLAYLYSKTDNMKGEEWNATDRTMLLYYCVNSGLYDVALQILDHHKKEVAKARDENALHVLAGKPSEFAEKGHSFIWRLINKKKKNQALEVVKIIWLEVVQLKDEDIWKITAGPPTRIRVRESNHPAARLVDIFTGHNSGLLFVAAKVGNTIFIVEILRLYPELIWKLDNYNRTIFHIAVLYRQESVYNLLYEIGSMKHLLTAFKDVNDNNILHLAAMKPNQNQLNNISGVALQMQRELQWFKEVQTMVHPSYREAKNKFGKTPQEIFTEEHAYLMEKGESWMKSTSSQCMVIAALIATIMFAAAFTLPGGNNSEDGHPIYLTKTAFLVFVITDAISLFTSSASIVMFLAILTARYREEDFLKSLPMKLMIGLLTLLVAITTMMIAFGASFFLVYTRGKWVPYLIVTLAGAPVILFALLQYHLFMDVIRPTFFSKFQFSSKKNMF